LYFSGGVDSSLLAARLQALGLAGIHLINFSFGADDPEGQQALRVAGHLGLDCQQVIYEPASVAPMLRRIGRDYSFPFVDRSVIPTNLLVRASLPSITGSRIVVEGTGADGAFGAWQPNSRVANLPQPVRELLAGGYGWLGLWRQPSEMERVARLARGSVQMSAAHSLVIAQNVLDQIAYRVPEDARQDIEGALGKHIQVLGAGLEIEQQFSLLDLVHICAGIFAAKSFDPLRTAGIRPVYPFLEPPMLRLSTSLAYRAKSSPGNAKAVLKRLLARHLPSELIDRPKSGFVPPMQSILAQPAVQAFVQESVLAADNPVLDYCRAPALHLLLARAADNQPLTKGAYRFVWAVIFASAWLKQSEGRNG
jgi:asparagine synthase (glutamine-hydrolysing)